MMNPYLITPEIASISTIISTLNPQYHGEIIFHLNKAIDGLYPLCYDPNIIANRLVDKFIEHITYADEYFPYETEKEFFGDDPSNTHEDWIKYCESKSNFITPAKILREFLLPSIKDNIKTMPTLRLKNKSKSVGFNDCDKIDVLTLNYIWGNEIIEYKYRFSSHEGNTYSLKINGFKILELVNKIHLSVKSILFNRLDLEIVKNIFNSIEIKYWPIVIFNVLNDEFSDLDMEFETCIPGNYAYYIDD